jgi:uncharacterized membrane protein
MFDRTLPLWLLLIATCPTSSWAAATEPKGMGSQPVALPAQLEQSKKEIDYDLQIEPLLTKHCVGCHGPKMQESELRLDSISGMLIGGKKGPAIVPGKSDESHMIKAIRGEGRFRMMPPGLTKLNPKEAQLLIDWIDAGAGSPKKR